MNYFQKILELQGASPRMGITTIKSTNSLYTAYCGYVKNGYLLIGSEHDEDCMYGIWLYFCRDCTDNCYIFKCELCYECLDCEECYGCNFSQDCSTCRDCSHCYDCKSCSDCFGCSGLRTKKFHILNKPYSKKEYFKRIAEIKAHGKNGTKDFLREFEELKKKTPRLFMHVVDNENCSGDYLYHSKNSHGCFDCKKMEDCMYMTSSIEDRDCMEMSNSYFGCELSYEVMSSIELYNCNYSNFCYYSRDLEYSEYLFHCNNCFGCFFLQHKEFYIFNEPYSREEYFKKVAEIKDAMRRDETYGKHLPSTFRFEDSAVLNYFPRDSILRGR